MNLDQLREQELALAGEMESLRHELRRVKDGLERCGGADRALEQKVRQLSDNISMCEKELLEIQQLLTFATNNE